MQSDDIPIDPNDPELAEKLHKEAKEGNVVAQWRLAAAYYHGLFVEEDNDQFFHWSKLAAEQGHKEGCFLFGFAHAEGLGTPQNREEAVKWFLRAAEQDHSNASLCLGRVYMSGGGVLRNPISAYKWLMWGQLLANITLSKEDNNLFNMDGTLESIEEQIESLKEEMTEGQLEQADKVWNSYLEERLERGLKEQEGAVSYTEPYLL
jgi:hypothetical protein